MDIKNIELRNMVNRLTREWFSQKDFLEVETPILSSYSSLEKHVYPIQVKITTDHQQPLTRFLRVSPELAMKKMIAAGHNKIFELGKCFRNHESLESPHHLFEFNMLEWYHRGIDMNEMVDEFISLINYLFKTILRCEEFDYLGKVYSLKKWQKISVKEAFKKFAKIDFDDLNDWEDLVPIAKLKMKGKVEEDKLSLDDAFYWIFLNEVEPRLLNQPTILYHYPEFQASFSKLIKVDNKRYGLRFEVYLGGLEIANAFEELCDAQEQEKRWQDSVEWFQKQGQIWEMDREFIEALKIIGRESLMSGIAVGWDRVMMLLANEAEIKKVT